MLLERDPFLAKILRHDRGVIAVAGEAGIGKTSLVARVAEEVNLRVLWSGCEALFTPRPLGPLFDLAHELGPAVDALLSSDTNRERLFPAVLAAAGAEPTLLVVEDVHWADRATLDFLKYLVRRMARVPLLLVLTYRDDEVAPDHPLVSLLGESASIRRIVLPRLSMDAVRTLARDRDAAGVYALTGGNPFYVTEFLASGEDRVPPTVRDAVLARAAKLSPAARRIVELASTVPGKAERRLIEEALHPSSEEIEEASTSGILTLQHDAFVFRHELGRRAIEDSLPEVRRQSLHATILALLQMGEGISPARLAHHAEQARDAAAILRFAPLAAEEAIRADAHREAAAHSRRVLAHLTGDRERAELLEKLAYECYLTQQEEEALGHRMAALALWRRLGERLREGDNLRWASRLNWFAARNAAARECAAEAIAVLEQLPPGPELAMAWSNQAQLHMLAQESAGAVRFGNRAIELATKLGDDVILAHALNNVGTIEELNGEPDGARKLEESLRISLAHGYQEHAARAYTNIGSGAVRLLDYARAEKYLEEGIAYSTDRDLDAWRIYMLAWRARLHLEHGDWTAAAEDALTVLAFRGAAPINRIPALAVLGRIRIRRGDPGAMALLDEGRTLAAPTAEFQRIAPIAAARAEAAWLRGDRAAAVEEARDAFAMGEQLNEPWARGELAYYLWRGGAIDAPSEGIASPYAKQIAGDWRGAAAEWETIGRPYEAAQALADSDDPDDLRRARDLLDRLGDRASATRLRRPRPSTLRNPHGLTAREMEILALLADGLRNSEIADRLYVSPKTVDHHVSAVLAKLGARTRGEAAARYRSIK